MTSFEPKSVVDGRWRFAGFCIAALVLAAPHVRQVDAQSDLPIPFRPGFTPDPVVLRTTIRGTESINNRAPGCRGYVGANPSFIFDLQDDFPFLRVIARGAQPMTLILMDPNGRYFCSGRPIAGQPREEGQFQAGRWEVWVGTTQPSTVIDLEVLVTENPSITPEFGSRSRDESFARGSEIGLVINTEQARFERANLQPGFLPDPHILSGESGGNIDASRLGGNCRGFVSAGPNHVISLEQSLDYFRVQTRGVQNAVLVIRTPDAQYLCSDDDEAVAMIEQESWRRGRYLVWIGEREEAHHHAYQLLLSETRLRPQEPE